MIEPEQYPPPWKYSSAHVESLPGAIDHSPATPSQSTASHRMSAATGQVDPTSLIRCRRSDQPTGRGFDVSNVRMASISLWAKVGFPGGGRSSSHTARTVQKIDGGEAAGRQADATKIDLAWRWPLRLAIVRQPSEGRQNSW